MDHEGAQAQSGRNAVFPLHPLHRLSDRIVFPILTGSIQRRLEAPSEKMLASPGSPWTVERNVKMLVFSRQPLAKETSREVREF